MKKITLQELRDFVVGQPDDAPVELYDGTGNNGPGCVLVQYARSKGIDFVGCGFNNIKLKNLTDIETDFVLDLFVSMSVAEEEAIKTFGELKEKLI